MAKMKVGGGRIHPQLDPQRPSLGKLGGQLGGRNYFHRAPREPLGQFLCMFLVHCGLKIAVRGTAFHAGGGMAMTSDTLVVLVHRAGDAGSDDRLGRFGRAFDYRVIDGKLVAGHGLQYKAHRVASLRWTADANPDADEITGAQSIR